MPAALLVTVLSTSLALPRLKRPPPSPPALLPLTALLDTVSVPLGLLKMPAPLNGVWLSLTVLSERSIVPLLPMPPAPA